jgi:hypothetical protein
MAALSRWSSCANGRCWLAFPTVAGFWNFELAVLAREWMLKLRRGCINWVPAGSRSGPKAVAHGWTFEDFQRSRPS